MNFNSTIPLARRWPHLPGELRQSIIESVGRGLEALKIPMPHEPVATGRAPALSKHQIEPGHAKAGRT